MRRSTCWVATIVAALAVGLLASTSASAAYEQVGTFAGTPGELQVEGGNEESARWPEEAQLAGASGMAVNYTGAGGVPVGTVYAVTHYSYETRIARFNPDGKFSEAWTFNEHPGFKERCGPEGDPAHPVCGSRPREGGRPMDVDVDQTTGNVYVLGQVNVGENKIHVYSADGSKLITQFGVQAGDEATATSPDKFHGSSEGGLAVDAAGNVYVFDLNNNFEGFYHRLMVFKPQAPGDYEHYVYAGQSHDVWAGFTGRYPQKPVTDDAGDIYVAGEEFIAKLDPSQPAAAALCEFKFPKGGIEGMTVNPQNGEVFFFTYNDSKVHQLAACDAEGKFAEIGKFALSPKRTEVLAMAVNPVGQFEPSRTAGVLYVASTSGAGGPTKGTYPSPVEVESALGYVFAPPRELAPEVLSESVSAITSSSARLEGTVNPKGSAARYVFQYLSDAAYQANEPADRFAGAAEVPLGGGLLEGSLPLPVGDAISGLSPEGEYRYRVLATSHCSSEDLSKVCIGAGAAKAFRTYPPEAPGLPDGRAFELVSPALKHGGQVMPTEPDTSSCAVECKPGGAYNHSFPRQSALDGDAIVYEGTPFAFDEGAKVENEYVSRRGPSGWQTTNLTPKALFSKSGGFGYRAFTPDLTEGLFGQIAPSLSPEAPSEYSNLYRQPSGDPLALSPLLNEANATLSCQPGESSGSLKLHYAGASADLSRFFFEANDALTPEATGGCGETNLYEWSAGQLRLVNRAPGDTETLPGSSFGSSLSATNAISKDGSRAFWSSKAGQLYVRIDGSETLEVKAPGKFLVAADDGSRVLLNDGCLYDLGEEECEDLTSGKGGFEGISGQAEDLSHVYFVDTAVLTGEEENGQGAKAQAGKDNLYAWQEGATTFIATLLGKDGGSWAIPVEDRSAEASPAGRWLAFISKAPLSGYDNTGLCGSTGGGEILTIPCPEVFLYDSQSAELICASCPPSGAPPLGSSVLRRMPRAQPRYLLDSGRLYFDSQSALSQFDTNGRVEDVYQYEPNAVGSCERAGGCVSLISAGRGGADSNLLATDPSGKNVFFTTRDHLNKPDQDEAIDLYDARVGGTPLVEPEVLECQGEACQPPASAPNDPTPGSSSFDGSGNVVETKAPKRHKKKRKHAKQKQSHKRAAKHNRGGAK